MRFAGTCSRYSNRAMPQLAIAAIHHGLPCMLRKCPYQANVMKRLEPVRRIAALSAGCCSMKVGMTEEVRGDVPLSPIAPPVVGRRDLRVSSANAVIEFALFRGRKGLEQTP